MEKDEEYINEEMEEELVKDYLPTEEAREDSEDDSIYSEEGRDELMEDDEISPEEAGFMEGYDEAYA